jgi:hypothetical protein
MARVAQMIGEVSEFIKGEFVFSQTYGWSDQLNAMWATIGIHEERQKKYENRGWIFAKKLLDEFPVHNALCHLAHMESQWGRRRTFPEVF